MERIQYWHGGDDDVMDLDIETLSRNRRFMCILTIGKLSQISFHLYNLWEWRDSNPKASLSYIDKSQKLTLIGKFFVKKPTSTVLIRSLICRDISSVTVSGIVFYVGFCSV